MTTDGCMHSWTDHWTIVLTIHTTIHTHTHRRRYRSGKPLEGATLHHQPTANDHALRQYVMGYYCGHTHTSAL